MGHPTLTDVALRKLSPPASGSMEVWDGRLPGFGVRVSPKGTKSFILLYRHEGRPKRLTIGRYPMLTLSDARKAAQKALADVAQGTDPSAAKKKTKPLSDPFNFVAFVTAFIEKYAAPKNKDWRESHRLFKREFIPHWRQRDIRKITKRDVTAVIDGIVARGSPGAANHALAAVRRLFNWGVERGLLELSPVQGLKPPAKLNSRDRVLSDAELVSIWNAAGQEGYPFGSIVRLLILSGQRRGEVMGMRWCDVDTKALTWTLPGELNKSGRMHILPLTNTSVVLIDALPRLSDVLVFPSRSSVSNNPVSGMGKAKGRIAANCKIDDWRLHDIRRTVATGMARLKISPHVVEKVLNHSSGTFAGVAGVYNRFGYLDEMREALEVWDRHLIGLLGNT